MGDERRNVEFARFIVKQFPKAKSVLVVADGKGELARKLANKGLSVRVVENKPRFEGRKHTLISYKKGWFNAGWQIEEDVVVAMHPDEATGEILAAANAQGKPFAVVPCCAVGKFSKNINRRRGGDWIKRLKGLFPCSEATLRISGRNTVLYRR